MMRFTDDVAALERRHTAQALEGLSYHDALARFTSLWIHARNLSGQLRPDWRKDVEADLTLQAWAFKEDLRDGPRLRRDVVRVIRGRG
jgi:hypothetical protein